VAGCCLIRLGSLRPRGLPAALGLTTENAAHRIAVEWGDEDGARTGVFIPRQDSGSRLSVALGGRVFLEVQHHARFAVEETDERLPVAFRAHDGTVEVDVTAVLEPALTDSGLFAHVDEASRVFEDSTRCAAGAAVLDTALVMRKVPVAWDSILDVAAIVS